MRVSRLTDSRAPWEKKYGVPPLSSRSLLTALGDISISYTSSYFQPFASTAPASVRFVGWTLSNAAAGEPFPFEQLQGRPLIYVSLGTLNNDERAFFQSCIEAFAGTDRFVVMSTGNRIAPESFGALPENVMIRAWVPQVEVLKRAALFITHGGLNSVHDGLYLGLPLLLVPQQAEQAFNAMRVVELGAGLMLKKAPLSAASVHAQAERLLSEPRFKAEAKRIGETLVAAGGVTKAAGEIEALLQRRQGEN